MLPKPLADWVSYGANLLLVVVGIGGIVVAGITLDKIERQTAATEKQARHMVDSERPFLLIDNRGTLQSEIWVTNYGKTPAQILFISTLKYEYPEWSDREQDHVMPIEPRYDPFYKTAIQIHAGWIAPGKDRYIGSIEPAIILRQTEKVLGEIRTGLRETRVFSGIRYRGLFNKEAEYETCFCYGWNDRDGARMDGPPAYHKHT